MLVKFELETREGHIFSENHRDVEMNESEIRLMLYMDEIYYPLGNGYGAFCKVVHTIYEMSQNPNFIEVHLKEK